MEDVTGAAPSGEHPNLVGDPRPRGVHEVDDRHLVRERPLLDAEDLLDRLRSPRPGLHGGVVRHQRDRPATHRSHPGDHAVGAQALLLPIGEQALLGQRALIEEPRDPLPHRQLLLLGDLLPMPLGPALQRGVEGRPDVAH